MTKHYEKKEVLFPFMGLGYGGANISGISIIENLNLGTIFSAQLILTKDGPENKCPPNIEVQKLPVNGVNLNKYRGLMKKLYLSMKICQLSWHAFNYLRKTKNKRIIHVQDSISMVIWWLPSFLLGRKLIWHVRATTKLNKKYKVLMHLPKALLFVSQFDPNYKRLNAFSSDNNRKKVDIFYPTINSSTSGCLDPSSLKKGLKLLQVGCSGERKRLAFTLDLLRLLKANSVICSLTLVGVSNREEHLIKEQYNDLSHSIIIHKWVENPAQVYAKNHILIHPSKDEAFGRVQIEALNHGLYVISAKSQASRTVIISRKLGKILGGDDILLWMETITDCLGDETFLSLSKHRIRYSEKFLASRNIRKLETFYQDISQ